MCICSVQITAVFFFFGLPSVDLFFCPWRPRSTLIWPRPRRLTASPLLIWFSRAPFSQTGENLRKLNISDVGRGYFRLYILFHVLPALYLMGGVLFFSSDPHRSSAISCTIYLFPFSPQTCNKEVYLFSDSSQSHLLFGFVSHQNCLSNICF